MVNECYCQNGHNLVSERAIFDGHKGILLKIQQGAREGLVALSPVYGFRSRFSLDLPLYTDELWEVKCPTCNENLPKFSRCSCEGDLVTMFLDKNADYSNCIIVCNRIDCFNSGIKYNNEIIYYSGNKALL